MAIVQFVEPQNVLACTLASPILAGPRLDRHSTAFRTAHDVNDPNSSPPSHDQSLARQADASSRDAALTLSLALPGDTLLYLLLPIYAMTFGVSLPEAGILLAANRLIRIAGYGWVGRFYATHGPRTACLVASVGAIISTFIYAIASGIWLLLIARLIWGLSYAAMNIANQALPTSVIVGAPARVGRSRAIIAVGPTVSLIAGALLATAFGPRSVFLVLTAVALLAPLFACRIAPQREPARLAGGPRFEKPGPISIWSFSIGFTIDGLFIFGLGLLAAASFPTGAVLAAGLAMSMRYGTEILFAPVGGELGRRFGALPMLIAMSLATAVAMLFLGGSGLWLWIGAAGTIVLRAIAGPLSAPVVAEMYPGAQRVPALARQATWRDIGAGAGPIAAGLIFPILSPLAIYGGGAMLIGAASLWLLRLRPPSEPT
jgi:predicted MFS family arabinose efflux permease